MTEPHQPNLGAMICGYWISQSIYAVAKLGIADLLQKGPQTAEQLAAATGTQAGPLYRLLRALASLGVMREDEQRRFSLTPAGELLQSDNPGSHRALSIMMGEEQYRCWSDILYTLKTGKNSFEKNYGEPIFDWLSKHPEQAATFDMAMVGVHGREVSDVLEAYDFGSIRMLADIGGGNGSVLRGILPHYPNLQGRLCDLPNVVERARPLIVAAGLADRMEAVPTNFFESVMAGADAYFMRHIIHDWDDDQCRTILGSIRRAIPADGRLLVVESVIKSGNSPDLGKLLDLHMMIVPGGQERTEPEYQALFQSAGFRISRIVPTPGDVSVIEAHPC